MSRTNNLTSAQVREIYARALKHETSYSIAKAMGLPRTTVRDVIQGVSHRKDAPAPAAVEQAALAMATLPAEVQGRPEVQAIADGLAVAADLGRALAVARLAKTPRRPGRPLASVPWRRELAAQKARGEVAADATGVRS